MTDSKFEELVKKHAAEQRDSASEIAARQERQQLWWQERIAELLDRIERWLAPLIAAKAIEFSRTSVRLVEEPLGTYEAQSGVIRLGVDKLTIEPVGSVVIGAFGRVDLVSRKGTVMLLLSTLDPLIPEEQRQANAEWVVSYPIARKQLIPLTRDAFERVFTALFAIGE